VCKIAHRVGSSSFTYLRWRFAVAAEAPALVRLIWTAYRGPASYERWTSEEHLVRGTRTDERAVLVAIEPAGSEMLVVDDRDDGGAPIACCRIADRGHGLSHFGMFAVDPEHQGGGLGRRLVGWAEQAAARSFGAREVELDVVAQQELLRAWYERLGYTATGETRPFPPTRSTRCPSATTSRWSC
jgi:GNAT superfamily N-acetyltransferase